MESISSLSLGTPQNGLPVSKGLAIILFIFSLIGFLIPSSRNVFALVPGYAIPPHFYIWNIVTSGYFEVSIINAFANILSLVWYGKYLEAIWGSKEFVRFIAIINALSGVATFVLMMVLYILSRNLNLWFDNRLCGFSGIIGGFSIAMRQLIPEEPLIPSVQLLRAKHSTPILLGLNLAFASLGIVPVETLPFTFFGIFFAWVYLRFYQVKDNVVGDMSDSFSFASFFPESIQPPIQVFSNVVFNILKICHCCTRTTNQSAPRTSSDSFETERRRARALAVLDQRMQQMKQFGHTDITKPTELFQEV